MGKEEGTAIFLKLILSSFFLNYNVEKKRTKGEENIRYVTPSLSVHVGEKGRRGGTPLIISFA